MKLLTIKTDQAESEVCVGGDCKNWHAHKELSRTILKKIDSLSLEGVEGIVVYKGPGSFTGLRIGMTVANAIASSKSIPIVSHGGKHWKENGEKRLRAGENEEIAMPEYGREANITKPKNYKIEPNG